MLVAAFEAIPYALPFADPYVTSRGPRRRREMALGRIATESGLVGLGEAVPLSLRGTSSLAQVVGELRALGDELVGADLAADAGPPALAAALSPPAASAI